MFCAVKGDMVKLNINPFNAGNPMTLKDAAAVALIAAFAVWILQFFANAQWDIIVADAPRWVFEAVRNYLVSFAGIFVSLAGLEQLVKKSKETS